MVDTQDKYGALWSHDELVLVLYLYCQIPFGLTHHGNADVQALASALGRTPSSVARKLGNFGAFDPVLASRGISGLTHVSKADRAIWNEYYGRWDSLVDESRVLLENKKGANDFFHAEDDATEPPSEYLGQTEGTKFLSVRLCQAFFRRAVLSSYNKTCCVCGLDIPTLLTASHIIPWSENEQLRADPENGLCLCALHDRAYDRGIITVSDALRINVSSLAASSKAPVTDQALLRYEGQPISLPYRFAPKVEYLSWHLANSFQP